jgi:osmotically-inducible protein OsmY
MAYPHLGKLPLMLHPLLGILRKWCFPVKKKGTGKMRKLSLCGYVWLLITFLAAGCSREDTDRLAKIGQISKERTQAALANMEKDHIATKSGGLTLFPSDVAHRVQQRLKSDKKLAELNIEISAEGGEVELQGIVHNDTQRKRAVELASETVGVAKVKDNLKVQPD